MAAIASTDVTVIDSWDVPIMGGRTIHNRILDIALSGNGGTADDIPATTLGFASGQLRTAVPLRYLITSGSTLSYVPVVIEADGNGILTINLADATDATRVGPANVPSAGTLRVHLTGIRAN